MSRSGESSWFERVPGAVGGGVLADYDHSFYQHPDQVDRSPQVWSRNQNYELTTPGHHLMQLDLVKIELVLQCHCVIRVATVKVALT